MSKLTLPSLCEHGVPLSDHQGAPEAPDTGWPGLLGSTEDGHAEVPGQRAARLEKGEMVCMSRRGKRLLPGPNLDCSVCTGLSAPGFLSGRSQALWARSQYPLWPAEATSLNQPHSAPNRALSRLCSRTGSCWRTLAWRHHVSPPRLWHNSRLARPPVDFNTARELG